MNRLRFNQIALISIIIIASIIRLWGLGSVPPSPDWDEAALGYNAYSIMLTGKDEYGEAFPVILRSFDDYKPALYTYLIIPFIKIFELNVFAVRFPSAIFGVLTVLATYFLVLELFKKLRFLNQIPASHVALLTSFLLAISPWHIQFSRIAFEANVGLTLNVFAVLFFIYGFKKPYLLVLSAISMALALYAYQSEKVYTPLLFLLLAVIFRKELFKLPRKYFFIFLLSGIITAFPIVHYTFTNTESLARARGVSVFSIDHQFIGDYAQRNIINREKNDLVGIFLDNRRILYAKFVLGNYLSHFDLNWLFISGDQARHHAPHMGLLYIWELPFLLIGIYILIFTKLDRKIKFFILGWFLLAPIPASVTTGVPHAIRTLNFLPTFQIFIAVGILTVWAFIKTLKFIYFKFLIAIFIFVFFVFNFLYYLNQYFVQQNYYYSEAWQYGYKETIDYIETVEKDYEKIIVSNEPHLDQSYMFFLFYLKYPPQKYQQEGASISGGFAEDHKFGKYEFKKIKWDTEEKNDKILYVGRPDDFQYKAANVIKRIDFLNGKPAIHIVRGQ